MSRPHVEWPGIVAPALLAAFTTWASLWAWRGFVAAPSSYLDPALASVLLVAATGIALRAFRVPSVVVLLAQLVVTAMWLTHLWAPEEALAGWVPTTSSVAASLAFLGEGVAAAQSYAAPVPETVPQLPALLLATGSLVAVLVDFIANGLRRVPVAGLPLLAVYTAPVSILDDGVPWWVFVAGAAGFLSLIASDEARRLEHWGRRVPHGGAVVDTAGGAVATTSLRGSARRIGLTATTLAVVAPLVVPTLSGSFLPGGGPGGDGGNSVTISNPMVDLRRDLVRGRDVDLLRITTENADPSYLRISVLDTFNGLSWKPSDRDIPPEQQADGLLPRPPGLDSGVARNQVDYAISVEEAFDSTWLPTPYPATRIEVPGDWRYDTDTLDFISAVDGQSASGLEYSLSALEIKPSAARLVDAGPAPESIFTPFTELPDDLSDSVSELAREVTQGLDSRFEKAVRLQRWFREDGGFEYSLEPEPGTGADDLEAFLSDEPGGRVGYCEQFAASMALMGRTLGIPSRVAVGFLRPDQVGENEYVYSAHDLHAWPEMYFEGTGWVRFEPTPDRAPEVPGYTTADVNTPEPADLPTAPAASANPRDIDQERLRGDALATGTDDQSTGGGGWGTGLVLTLALAVLLLSPWLTRSVVRRRRWATATTPRQAAEAGWRELRDVALDHRLPWDDAVTLRTRARAIASAFGRPGTQQREGFVRGAIRGAETNPEAAAALDRLVQDVELARYSRDGDTGRAVAPVRADVETCAAAIRAGTLRQRRRAATWLPASLVRNRAWRIPAVDAEFGHSRDAAAGVDRAV